MCGKNWILKNDTFFHVSQSVFAGILFVYIFIFFLICLVCVNKSLNREIIEIKLCTLWMSPDKGAIFANAPWGFFLWILGSKIRSFALLRENQIVVFPADEPFEWSAYSIEAKKWLKNKKKRFMDKHASFWRK